VEPFSDFAAKVVRLHDALAVIGTFTLGNGSDGVDPQTQLVTLTVGSYTATLPAGAITKDIADGFLFRGRTEGVPLKLIVVQTLDAKTYRFAAEVGVVTHGSSDLTVSLTIGDDAGTTVAQ
jgi:hypothetical protein